MNCQKCGSERVRRITPEREGEHRGQLCEDCGHFRDITAEVERAMADMYKQYPNAPLAPRNRDA